MIKMNKLGKKFSGLQVLRDITTEIQEGEIYGLVGASGAGKSTLLRCINGLTDYDIGSLIINGVKVGSLSKDELRDFRREIGMIFQQFSLLERLTVYDNIALPMRCWNYNKAEIEQTVDRLLNVVGLEDKKESKPRELSGGQKQRVAIARALTMNPKILLCDEATSALDPSTATSILELLKSINEELGVTMVVVAHDMDVIRQVCHKVALLRGGELVEEGLVEEVFINNSEYLQELLGVNTAKYISSQGENIKIVLRELPGESERDKVMSKLAIETGVEYTYVWGGFNMFRNKLIGNFVINVDSKNDLIKITNYLDSIGIEWRKK